MYRIYSPERSSPGNMAPANNFPTEISAIGPYMTSMMLGGMRMPRVPPAATAPAESDLSYPLATIGAMAMIPIVVTEAAMTPVQAANTVATTITVMASPPRMPPSIM